ncbi:carbonic anhydrase [Kocuria rosea subsp. polaris]|uniref:carbonic anhydrase n=1 Tax=Kocuria rosea subsp. polaris TaxID=136273 RepID=A0A0W8I9Q5_KOCRO|nr:carbonic anhydrase [Kocuria polaris]KUG56655.1 carbonic anhydrase [Kocuria polaris]
MNPDSRPEDTSPRTPAAAWQRLREGNARFIAGESLHPNQDASRRQSVAGGQNPFAVIFGCSDSRLAAEIIFDLGLGDAFVVRTAGQVIDDAVLGSIEYSVANLGTPLIMVLGHDSCGAVTAAHAVAGSGQMPRGFQRDLIERIMPSVLETQRAGRQDVNSAVVEHTKQTASRLMEQSRVIADAVSNGDVAVVGVFYHLEDGEAELVHGHGTWLPAR